ncbi:hypothetical protein GH733_000602 [Mirounga leonina]|nr:hypothetical protein GH733_000602 [Mirounga leonina]
MAQQGGGTKVLAVLRRRCPQEAACGRRRSPRKAGTQREPSPRFLCVRGRARVDARRTGCTPAPAPRATCCVLRAQWRPPPHPGAPPEGREALARAGPALGELSPGRAAGPLGGPCCARHSLRRAQATTQAVPSAPAATPTAAARRWCRAQDFLCGSGSFQPTQASGHAWPVHPRAGGGPAVHSRAGPGTAAAAGRVPVCGRPLGTKKFDFLPWNSHAVMRHYENKPYFVSCMLGLKKTEG